MKKPKPRFPETLQEAYNLLADIQDNIQRLRTSAQADLHPLELPEAAIPHLIEAHEALMAAHRAMEWALIHGAHKPNQGI